MFVLIAPNSDRWGLFGTAGQAWARMWGCEPTAREVMELERLGWRVEQA